MIRYQHSPISAILATDASVLEASIINIGDIACLINFARQGYYTARLNLKANNMISAADIYRHAYIPHGGIKVDCRNQKLISISFFCGHRDRDIRLPRHATDMVQRPIVVETLGSDISSALIDSRNFKTFKFVKGETIRFAKSLNELISLSSRRGHVRGKRKIFLH